MRRYRRYRVMLLVLFTFLLAGCGAQATPTPLPVRLPTVTPVEIPTVVWTPREKRVSPSPSSPPTRRISLATPTPAETSEGVGYGWVKPLKARLRVAPRLDADTVAVLPAGTSLRLLGRTADGRWYRVRALLLPAGELEGWMAAEVVVTFANPERLPVVSVP